MKLTHPQSDATIEVAEAHADKYLEQGWRSASAPAGNASLSDWQDYARDQGWTEDQIEGVSRDDLRAALSS